MYRRTPLRGKRRNTDGEERGTRLRTRGTRGEEAEGRGRGEEEQDTRGGSSQSSGWVSTRPVIIGAYLHEHTSNVPNQTSSYVARIGRHCTAVFIKRVSFFFPLFFLVKKKEKEIMSRNVF